MALTSILRSSAILLWIIAAAMFAPMALAFMGGEESAGAYLFAAAAAGVQILSSAELQSAKNLLVAADVNAVPPPGVEGMDLFMKGEILPGCTRTSGVGPLAIGDIKYKTQAGLFTRMINATEPVHLDFRDAFKLARSFVA